MDLWPLLLPLIGLMVVPATAAPLTVRLVSVGSLPPALLGFLEDGLRRELGAAVRMGGNLPLPVSCPEGLSQYPGALFWRRWRPPARPGMRSSWGSPGWTSRRPVSTLFLVWPIPGTAPQSFPWPASTRSFTASPGTPPDSKSGLSPRRSTNWGTYWAWATAPIRPASCLFPIPWPTPIGRGRDFAGSAGRS